MNKYETTEHVVDTIKSQGFYIERDALSELEIKNYLEIQLPEFERGYSEMALKQKIYRKREDTEGRLGDAMMVCISEPDTAPFIKIKEHLASLYLNYISVLGILVGEKVKDNTKCLFNYQYYKEGASNSLPFHFDSEIFEGEWTKDYIELKEGLIPRLVMVIVLENENDGKGLSILSHEGKRIDLVLNPGDVLYFDNTKVLHGVPEDLPKKRTMMGFRSFEIAPLYFNEIGLLDGTEVIQINTPYVKGEAIELSTEEAKEMLKQMGRYYD